MVITEKQLEEMIDLSTSKAVDKKLEEQKLHLKSQYAEIFEANKKEAEARGHKPADAKTNIGRFAKTVLLAKGDIDRAISISEKQFPEDKVLQNCFKALGANNPADGGFLVPSDMSMDVIEALYNKLAVVPLGARRLDMPNGNMNLPRIDTSASAYYVDESADATKSQQVFGNVKLNAKKLVSLVPVSNDLLKTNSAASEAFIRDDMLNIMKQKMDYTALYGSNTENIPGGLATLLASGQKTGSSSTAFTADLLATIVGLVEQANIPGISYGWAINAMTKAYLMNLATSTGEFLYRNEMSTSKTILGYPFVVSNNVSYTAGSPGYVDFFFGDWSEFLIGMQSDLELAVSDGAAYYNGSSTVSGFSKDETVLRVISRHDFGIRHPGAFIQGTYKLATS